MDKVLSADERIRRAEEIYYRRKMNSNGSDVARVNVGNDKRKYGLLKKTILQIAICIVIYLSIHLVQTTDYYFSQSLLNKTKQILSYDINFQDLYNNTKGYINSIWKNKEEEAKIEDEQNIEKEETVETLVNENELMEETEQAEDQTQENLTQEEQDIKYILENVPMTKPLLGTITSRFGPRESDNPIVSKYHTGIDIAVNEGTSFVSSMEGTVKEVSSEGLYRSTCNYTKWRS